MTLLYSVVMSGLVTPGRDLSDMGIGTIVGAIASLLVGGTVAAVTVMGLASSQVNTPADRRADVNAPVINYGSTE